MSFMNRKLESKNKIQRVKILIQIKLENSNVFEEMFYSANNSIDVFHKWK